MEKNKLSIAAGIILVFMTGYLLYNQNILIRENKDLRRMLIMNQSKSGKTGKAEDPYIAGPVKNRIIKGYANIKECYSAYLTHRPEKKDGKIKIDWQIDAYGAVITPQVVFNEFNDKVFGECITSRIAKWKFPEPALKTYISHTFKFRDASDKKKQR